jgi:hypothetical protein
LIIPSHITQTFSALRDKPDYLKALQRRADSNEKLNTWSSLTAAQTDYLTIASLSPNSRPPPQLKSLPAQIEEAKKKETEMMLGKLKDIGNGLLGKFFGMSLDDFKFEKSEGGGYSLKVEKSDENSK